MRFRTTAVLITTIALCILLFLRQHLLVLGDVLYTYSSFYPLLSSHPELLYKYPSLVNQSTQIPKIIHQIALGNPDLNKYKSYINSCRALHADWQFNMWTDENATLFIHEKYPQLWPSYSGYSQNIQRANILRYALLHTYGGVYLDLDITCLIAFESTKLLNLPFVTPGAHPAGVNNAVIFSIPRHSFLTYLLTSIPKHNLYWGLPMRLPYVENMLSAGCMFFSNQWMRYTAQMLSRHQGDSVYILADGNGDIRPHMLRGSVQTPIVAHGGASSWHGWDAAAMLVIGNHFQLVVTILGSLTVSITMLLFYRCLCSKLRRRRVWTKSLPKDVIRWSPSYWSREAGLDPCYHGGY